MKIVQVFCLSLFLSLCGATEYYVRPTEPTGTSCPAQPCLTLSHYISNSDLYFKSNTVFKFLPGLHHANQTLDMWSVENVSLEGEHNSDHPIVMMDINCSSHGCDGFQFQNMNNLTIHSLNISIYMNNKDSRARGFWFVEVSNLQMYHTSVDFSSSGFQYSSGIVVFECQHIFLYSTTVWGCNYCYGIDIMESDDIFVLNVFVAFSTFGLAVMDSRSISINDTEVVFTSTGMDLYSNDATNIYNVIVKQSSEDGIFIDSSQYTNIYNVIVKQSSEDGIFIDSSQYTSISNTVVMNPQERGIRLINNSNIDIMNTSVLSSGYVGIVLGFDDHVVVTNTSVTESLSGIAVFSSTDITISEVSVSHIGVKYINGETQIGKSTTRSCSAFVCQGLLLVKTSNTLLYKVRVRQSNVGVHINTCVNITVKNTTLAHVSEGITSVNGSKIHISHTILNISKFAIRARENEDSVIATVTIVFIPFQEITVLLTHCHNIQISSISLVLLSSVWMYQPQPAIEISSCNGVAISKTVFANFSNQQIIRGLPAVVVLFESVNIDFSDCSFERNTITALRVACSNFTVSGILRFTGNRANLGAAIIFQSDSTMTLSQNSSVFFVDNYAVIHGGAIYLELSGDSSSCVDVSHSECFLQLEQNDLDKRLTFVNNSAKKGGDVMYGRERTTCLRLFNNVSYISPDTLSKVTSKPSRVCICKNNTPACNVPEIEVDPIFPGQSVNVSAVVVGVEYGTVAGSVFATFLPHYSHRPQLAAGEGTQRVTQLHCNELQYTIFSRNTNEMLGLTKGSAIGDYSDSITFTEWPTLINITLLPCPPGFALMEASARCDCSQFLLQLPGVSCDIKDETIHRNGLVWVGSVKDENQTVENVITAKYCPLNYFKREDIRVDLNQPDTQCEFNHSGTLCGGCQPGLSLKLGGVQCGVCSNKNLALIIPFIMAGVVLVFFLKISNLTTSEGFINSLVFYASIVKANEHIFLPQANTNPLTLFISWLNLDLGVQTCFFNGLSVYSKTWLQFVFPFYIWGITGVIIISARYSTRIARISGNNSVPVLATLFLLSYAKLLGIIITSLSYTVLEYPGGQKVVWSADGNIDYLGAKHTPLFVAAVATLLFLWLPYTVLLFTGQWLYKCKLSVINRMLIKLKPFLDAHYGPLKDSHRYWFGALLLVRAVILLISALVIKNNFSVFIFSISIATFVLIVALMAFSHISIDLRAYHSKAVSFFEYSMFVNLVVLCLAKYHTSVGGGSEIAASYTLIGIVFVQFVGLLILRIYSAVKNKVFHYFPKNESKEEEGLWRYDDPIEMQTTQYRNANNIL